MALVPVYDDNGNVIRFERAEDQAQGQGAAQSAPSPDPRQQPAAEDNGDWTVLGEAGRAVVGGVRDAAQETLETIDYLGDSITEAVGAPVYTDRGLEWLSADEIRDRGLADPNSFWGDLDGMGYQLPEVGENKTTVGGAARGIAQFLTGFVGGAKVLKGAGMGVKFMRGTGKAATAARGALTGSVADFAAFDAHEERFSDFLRENVGLEDPITGYLSADEEDTVAEGKLKNVLEGLGLGVAAEGLFAFTRLFKQAKKVANESGPEAGAEVMNEGLVKLEDENPQLFEQLRLSDETTDPNLTNPEIAKAVDAEEAFKRTSVNPQEVVEGAGEVRLYNAAGLTRPEARPKSPINVDGFRQAWSNNKMWKAGADVDFTEFTEGRLFNHDYMDGAPTVKEVLNLAADQIDPAALPNKTTFDAVYRGARNELANATRTSPDALDSTIRRMAADADRQKRVVVAGKMMIQDLAREIDALSRRIDLSAAAGKETVADEAKLVRHIERLGELEANLKSIITGSAQTTAVGRIRTKDVLTGKELDVQDVMEQIRSQVDTVGGSKKVRELAKKIKAASDDNGTINLQGITDIARKTKWGKAIDIHNEYWINAILSGPKTHLINIMSNAAHTAILPAEKMVGGVLTGNYDAVREGARIYAGMRSAVFDSFKMAGKAFWREQNILDPQGQIMEGSMRQYHAIDRTSLGMRKGPMGNLVDMLGKVVRLPSRALLTMDEFFKQLNYRAMTHARVVDKADGLVRSGKLDQKDVGKWIANQIEATIDRETGRGLADDPLHYAREVTFTQELEEGTFSRGLQTLVNKHPGMRVILPFVRTPTNILRATMKRTPLLGNLERRLKADLQSGDPIRVATARGQQATGAALWTGAIMLAMDGRITGGGPNDPALRARLLETGWQPYSFVLGNEEEGYRYVQFRRLDPFATFFGLAADFAEIGGQMGEVETQDLATMMVTAISNNLVSKTYLQGVVDAVKALAMPDWYAERWMQRYTSSYVPYSSAMRQIRTQDDQAMREVWSIMDAVKNTIPGYSETLPARRSWITGEPILYPKGWGSEMVSPVGEALAAANPITQGAPKGDLVLDELARLQHGFTPPQKTLRGVDLTSAQYSRLLELHGTVRIGRYTMHERLKRLMESYRYTDGAADRINPDEYRLRMVRDIISDYRAKAQQELVREDQQLAAQVRQAREQDGLRLRGSLSPLNQLVNR